MVHQCKDKEDFDAQLAAAGGKLVVVDFTATWCGPCQMISPKFEELSKQVPDAVFLKVDVDDNEETASFYNITCMPTFLFFKDGKKIDDFSGAAVEKLQAMVNKHK
eukprot:Rmarinus@m.12944